MPCELCARTGVKLTRHHLIPLTRHANKRARKQSTREQRHEVAWLCRPCHSQVHALLTEKQIEREFNTVELLAAHPDIARFVAWIREKPPGFRPTTRTSPTIRQ